ncbi:hypothetical protein STCU_12059 [Strigomonas culicis]|uniref:Uncharacterized protein n=1 Tax=Strigomonas culicis TaxID=28005 RepID=S9UXX4_9TRYP|nr:hypothetical protein STCU_12059 [Strigomonas culicis]|eukprot:EPY15395.1 hypothetical protein STCU_12059 [Strigomonas culicis]
MTLSSGSAYEGSWRADRLHGRGEFTHGKERVEFVCDDGFFRLVNDLNRAEKIDASLPEKKRESRDAKPFRAPASSSPQRARAKLSSFRSIGELGWSGASHSSVPTSPMRRKDASQTIPNFDSD